MATQSGRSPASLTALLFNEPQRFELGAAVRLLQFRARRAAPRAARETETATPIAWFRASPALTFPHTQIEELTPPVAGDPAELHVSFLGLNGPSGVLPRVYSELVLQQMKRKSHALRDFLDIFNDRAIRAHVEAARKYRLPATFESVAFGRKDGITDALLAVLGFGTPGVQKRLSVGHEVLLRYGGLLSRVVRSAAGLEQMLRDYLGHPARVIQLAGEWARIDPEDRTHLPSATRPRGNFARLGNDAVLGARVYDVQGRFRVRLGPLSYAKFTALLPGTRLIREVSDLVRTYVGAALACDIQLVLRREAVPACTVGRSGDFTPRLGLNTWLATRQRTADADDVVLRGDRLS